MATGSSASASLLPSGYSPEQDASVGSQEPSMMSGFNWKDVEAELGSEEAKMLHNETEAELLSPEFRVKVLDKMSDGEPVQKKSYGLFVLGPSASGKTYSLRQHVVDMPQGAIDIDGATIRECSETWKRITELAASRGLSGFTDYFQKYFKGPSDRVKQSILDSAINERSNVVVPETSSTVEHCIAMVDRFLDAGYQLKFVAIYAPKHICEERGKSREVEDGKKFSGKNWNASVQAILTVQEHLVSRGVVQQTGNVRIFDNSSDKPQEVDFDTVRRLLVDQSQTSASSQQGGWCETRLLAGVYSGQQAQRVEIIPSNFEDEVVDVEVVTDGGEPRTMKFDVATCKCGNFDLTIDASGRPKLSSGQDVMERVDSLHGMSLTHSLESIAGVLQGINFLVPNGEFRPWLDTEQQAAATACRVSGPNAAPTRDVPRALFMVAPSGGGKTTVLKSFSQKFDIDLDQSVLVDSSVYRVYHPQYDAVINNGFANGGIWYSAWPALKKVMSTAKKHFIHMAMKAKQDLCISDTGADSKKTLTLIAELKLAGYTVHMCGIFAEPEEIIARGVAREVEEGKRYNRDVKKLCKTYDIFAPAIQAINGKFCLVLNAQGRGPQLFQEGAGGTQIPFNLKEALVSVTAGPMVNGAAAKGMEIVKMKPAELNYIMEGNLNIVCAYNGANEDWRNMVIRMRKGDNSTYKTDVNFAKGVAARLLGSEYIDTGDLVGLEAAEVKAIDDAILSSRPSKRRSKRLDTEVRDGSGFVLAMKIPNLMAAPVSDAQVVTVELKPKCGLRERQGLPSRYSLLQYEKLNKGKIDKLSEFDPIKLLSGNAADIHATLADAMREPQNNIRIFIDGKPVFTEEVAAKLPPNQAVEAELDPKLKAAGINGLDCLLSILSGVLSSPTMLMPARLKRVQCWAAGETAPIANNLFRSLRDRLGDATGEVLSRVENFRLAVENLEDFPCDEEGITKAAEIMDDVLTQAHKRWDADIEKEVIRWLCRFLLGRTCHDVSVLVNFVQLPPDKCPPDVEAKMRRLRYRPLDFFGVPSGLAWTGIWYRTSVVDTDAKSADKIPEYALQLDSYAAAYHNRFQVSDHAKLNGTKGAAVPAAAAPATAAKEA